MEKLRNNVFVYMLLMLAFLASMLFGIFYGPSHPNLFFWMIMLIFATVVAMYSYSTIRNVILLVAGMILLAVVGHLLDIFILNQINNELLKFVVHFICIASIYCILAKHFFKMFKPRQAIDENVAD